MSRELTAVQTSAGKGKRSRPLSLYSPTSIIPKGIMRIMGIPIAEIQIEEFKDKGIKDIYIVTRFLDNREYLSNRFGDGNRFGLTIHYSDPTDDRTNNGSGDAILTNIEKKRLKGDSIWLPNDNLFEYDFEKVVKAHRDLGAVVSIMTVSIRPRDTIEDYGLIKADVNSRILKLYEKPKDERKVMEALEVMDPNELGSMRVPVNTAGYILNNDALMKISKDGWVVQERKKSSAEFDMAGNLIKGLLEHDYPVYMIPIDAWGDFGSITFFLDTFPEALIGKFPSIYNILKKRDYYYDASNSVWIHPDSLERKDKNEKTLKERIDEGRVKIGPNVFIGRRAIIEDGAEIRYSDIEKYGKIGKGAQLDHVYLSPYCEIGPHANLRASALGLQVIVNSSKKKKTNIHGRSVLGPEVHVPAGTILDDVKIFPGYSFEKKDRIYSHDVLKPSLEQITSMVKEYQKLH